MKECHLLGKLQVLSFHVAAVPAGRVEAEVAELGRSPMARGPMCHGE